MKYFAIKFLLAAFLLVSTNAFSNERVIHVFVALCDNVNQGIVPVPEKIGNGEAPASNLYWGCGYGVKSFFKLKSPDWKLVKTIKNPTTNILERCIFKHKTEDVTLVADAYRGIKIKDAIVDFFKASAGKSTTTIKYDNTTINAGGSSDLVAYVGHDGLMEFSIDNYPVNTDNKKRDAIMLSCISKEYFSEGIKKAKAYPLVWTTGLMAPEAYTLEAAIEGWVKKETNDQIRLRAAQAYHKYQKCGINGAKRLLVTGF